MVANPARGLLDSTIGELPIDSPEKLADELYRLNESMYVCMYGHTYSKSMDKPGKAATPARGQLNTKNEYISLSALFVPEIWSRGTGSAFNMATSYQ